MFRKNRKADKQSNDTKHTERNIVGRGNVEEEPKLEKGDLTAMLIAAVGVFLPVLILVAVFLIGILWLLFIR
jgi:hypothetical protein